MLECIVVHVQSKYSFNENYVLTGFLKMELEYNYGFQSNELKIIDFNLIQYPEINLETASKKFIESDLSFIHEYQQKFGQFFCIDVNQKQGFGKKYLNDLEQKHFLNKLEESKTIALNYLASNRFQEKLAIGYGT